MPELVRTHEHPGKCVKCGYNETTLYWHSRTTRTGTSVQDSSSMRAECVHCGFRWKVAAKDELGTIEGFDHNEVDLQKTIDTIEGMDK